MISRQHAVRVGVSVAVMLMVAGLAIWLATAGRDILWGAGSGAPLHNSAYIKFDGIYGEVQEQDHVGWSDVASFSQAVHSPGITSGAARRRGDVVLDDILVTKVLDKASPKLAEALLKGKVFPKVQIHLTRDVGDIGSQVYLEYELKNVIITNYRLGGSSIEPVPWPPAGAYGGGTEGDLAVVPPRTFTALVDEPLEEVSLNFEEIKVIYTEYDAAGKPKSKVEYSWKAGGPGP